MKNKRTTTQLEGEGSYSATRKYNARLSVFAKNADIDGLGQAAATALDGPERSELAAAEAAGKSGPRSIRKRPRAPRK
jgi:hypothetical protein